MCGESIYDRQESSKFSPGAAGETSSLVSLTVKLDKFLQNSLDGRELLGLGRWAGLVGGDGEVQVGVGARVCLSVLACKEQGTVVFPEQRKKDSEVLEG